MDKIGVQGSCIDDKYLWFSMSEANGLCRMDMETMEVEYVSFIPEEPAMQSYLFSDMKKHGNKLIMTPLNAKAVAIYDIGSGEFTRIPLTTKDIRNLTHFKGWGAFYSSVILGKRLYMLPFLFPGILSLDLDTIKPEYDDAFMDCIIREYTEGWVMFRQDIAVSESEDEAFATSAFYNGIIRICADDRRAEFVHKFSKEEKKGFSCIQRSDREFVLLLGAGQRLAIYDDRWNLKKEYSYENMLHWIGGLQFIGSVKDGENIIFVPYNSLGIIRFNVKTEKMDIPIRYEEPPLYVRFWIYKNKLYCFREYEIDVIRMEDMTKETVPVKLTHDFWECLKNEELREDCFLYESGGLDLLAYIGFIAVK